MKQQSLHHTRPSDCSSAEAAPLAQLVRIATRLGFCAYMVRGEGRSTIRRVCMVLKRLAVLAAKAANAVTQAATRDGGAAMAELPKSEEEQAKAEEEAEKAKRAARA